jgi:hypothetical protein
MSTVRADVSTKAHMKDEERGLLTEERDAPDGVCANEGRPPQFKKVHYGLQHT